MNIYLLSVIEIILYSCAAYFLGQQIMAKTFENKAVKLNYILWGVIILCSLLINFHLYLYFGSVFVIGVITLFIYIYKVLGVDFFLSGHMKPMFWLLFVAFIITLLVAMVSKRVLISSKNSEPPRGITGHQGKSGIRGESYFIESMSEKLYVVYIEALEKYFKQILDKNEIPYDKHKYQFNNIYLKNIINRICHSEEMMKFLIGKYRGIDGYDTQCTHGKNIFTIQQKVNERYLDAHRNPGYDWSAVTRIDVTHTRKWLIKPTDEANVYTIQQKINNRYLDAYLNQDNDWSAVTRVAPNSNRKWIIKPTDEANVFTIQHKVNERYLDAHLTESDNTTCSNDCNVVTRTIQYDDTQKWIINHVPAEENDKYSQRICRDKGSKGNSPLSSLCNTDDDCSTGLITNLNKIIEDIYLEEEKESDEDNEYCINDGNINLIKKTYLELKLWINMILLNSCEENKKLEKSLNLKSFETLNNRLGDSYNRSDFGNNLIEFVSNEKITSAHILKLMFKSVHVDAVDGSSRCYYKKNERNIDEHYLGSLNGRRFLQSYIYNKNHFDGLDFNPFRVIELTDCWIYGNPEGKISDTCYS